MQPELVAAGIDELLPIQRTGDESRHVSTIIRYLCIKLKHFSSESTDEEQQTRFELGSAFEDAIENALAERHAKAFPNRYVRVGELERDTLIGTPDLLDVVEYAVHEVKLTWASSNWEPTSKKFWRYWVQVKAYCKLLETTIGYLHVAHIMGDYRGSGPQYRVWRWEFTQQEIDTNWRMIVTNGEVMRNE